MISIEKMASIRYSFTITLQPKMYKYDASNQYDLTMYDVAEYLGNLNCEFTLVSELTKSYNIHYHGTIIFKTIKGNLKKKFVDHFRAHKTIGFVCIKDITDEPGWIEYISKGLADTKKDVGRPPIIIDQLEYFNFAQRLDYSITI